MPNKLRRGITLKTAFVICLLEFETHVCVESAPLARFVFGTFSFSVAAIPEFVASGNRTGHDSFWGKRIASQATIRRKRNYSWFGLRWIIQRFERVYKYHLIGPCVWQCYSPLSWSSLRLRNFYLWLRLKRSNLGYVSSSCEKKKPASLGLLCANIVLVAILLPIRISALKTHLVFLGVFFSIPFIFGREEERKKPFFVSGELRFMFETVRLVGLDHYQFGNKESMKTIAWRNSLKKKNETFVKRGLPYFWVLHMHTPNKEFTLLLRFFPVFCSRKIHSHKNRVDKPYSCVLHQSLVACTVHDLLRDRTY